MKLLMAADDPRHGSVAGYVAHGKAREPKCDPCKVAYRRWEKRQRTRFHLVGPAYIDALGTQRRIRALVALGHTLRDLDAALGRRPGYSHYVLTTPTVARPTAAKYAELYGRLCMTRPEGWAAERARKHAEKRDWPPPLAFDDIDDPTENPTGWQREEPRGGGWSGTGRHTDLDELLERGAGVHEAARVLGISVKALEKWCDRQGRRADFNRLTSRETPPPYQQKKWSA